MGAFLPPHVLLIAGYASQAAFGLAFEKEVIVQTHELNRYGDTVPSHTGSDKHRLFLPMIY